MTLKAREKVNKILLSSYVKSPSVGITSKVHNTFPPDMHNRSVSQLLDTYCNTLSSSEIYVNSRYGCHFQMNNTKFELNQFTVTNVLAVLHFRIYRSMCNKVIDATHAIDNVEVQLL